MPWMLGIGAGVGLLKNKMVDQPNYENQKTLQSKIAAYSPWTHMQATPPTQPNAFNSALQFGTTAALAKAAYGGKLSPSTTVNVGDGASGTAAADASAGTTSGDMSAKLMGAPGAADLAAATPQASGLYVADPSSADANGNISKQMPYTPSKFNPLTGGKLANSWYLMPNDANGQ